MEKIRYHIKTLKINGKPRPITLYSRGDIKKQKELYARYAQFFTEHTHESVYSFIPGYSNFDAAAAVRLFSEYHEYYIKIDIHQYYPSIRRSLLKNILMKQLPERDAQRICRYVFCCPSGISEGSPLSPAMSNIYLYDFDEEMSELPVTFYIRYCDDILFLTNIKPTDLYPHIVGALRGYGLAVNPEKSDIGFVADGLRYLGYAIRGGAISVQPEKVAEIMEKLNSEPNPKKRDKMANGFRAYYRSPLLLPVCEASVHYLNEYGRNEEITIFNEMLTAAAERDSYGVSRFQ